MEPNQVGPDQAKTLLWTFFAGRATPLQKQLLVDWLREEKNQELYYQALHEWEKSHPQLIPDTIGDWHRLLDRLTNASPAPTSSAEDIVRPLASHRTGFRWWMAAAAALLIGFTGWWKQDRLLYRTYATAYGEIRRFELPDGSHVTLNANSTLRFPRFLALQNTREARLQGEAEFSVIHTVDHRPFLVHTPDQLEVRVLGTEFIVYSRNRGSKVVLNRGKVTLRSLKTRQPALTIRPGDVVLVDRRGSFRLRTGEPLADHAAWKEQRFVFNRTPLVDIARQIKERFGLEVQLADSAIATRQLSGNYPAQNADDVLTMLTQVLNLRADRQGNVVRLSAMP
ncbi:anti-FecI sigma factor, FecR [Fibrisoma limi BUZ 3]|uniref:Anti-FecI sigma factor, FecR n=1 Tax=Fibrisoma limi BUZ 3 TaxID=1185876 RepID=I2GGD5_9BACT|nr:FecR domain-containing protein [Fibrisoma limi]CCH52960.1 anti-FecI sigma factor, FecR [Fibrisoma limi BUZ 3]